MTVPWAVVDADPERIAAELARRFPAISAWWGEFTGRWWALTRDRAGRYRLIEAASPAALADRLTEMRPPQPAPPGDRVPVAPSPVRPTAPRHRRPGRQGWLRGVLGSLIAT